jgi:uncharacterized membrane protein
MDQYFVVSSEGKEYGPVDLPGLIEWVRQSRVLRTTLIRKGTAGPVAAETLPELTAAFAPAPPFPSSSTTMALPTEFRSWEFIGQAWELVKPNWLPLALMFLIMAAMGATSSYILPFPLHVGSFLFFIIGGAIYVGIGRAILGLIAGKPPTVGMMFGGFDRFGQAFLAMLVTGILICIGTIFCIVPGIILSIMWMFVYLVMAETDLDFWPAMQASAKLAEGYWWELFCLLLACFVVTLLGVLACLVGVLVASPVVATAVALAYRFLQARKAATTA